MWEKKVREIPNVTKELSHLTTKTVTCDKNRADVTLVLLNMTIEPSNLRKKNKGTTICDKRTVKCDIRTVQCDNGTIKFEKQINEPLNVTK